jgi:zinc protease
MRKQWLAATAALLCTACFGAQAQGIQVQSKTLPNGMKILVQEDSSIPNIAFYTFYRVGSRNEHEGITGLSHFFEHMMFNGAKKYGHGEFDSALDNAGGSNNAYTMHDMTVYEDWTPSSALELLFDVEADRIQYLAFDPKVIDSERQVVYSERRLSVDNSNYGLLNEQLTAAAFTASPYHWPVVGWPTDIESWTIDDLKAYHAMGYAPANATVVIVGNVKAAEVFALADKYFAPIPSHDVPPPVRTKEPEQRGERRISVHKEAQLPLLMVAYHSVDAKNPDLFPLMVLDEVLTGGQSSRLYKALVDGQLALQVRTSQGTDFDPGTFEVSAQPRAGVAPEKVESVLYAEIEKLQTTPLDAHELDKAKNGMLANNVRQLATINGRASAIGNAQEYFGDWHKVNDFAAFVNAVTAADVQRVAAKYLTARNRTVATLIPDTAAKPSSTAGKTGGR